jgi:hypothetical protein
MMAKSPEFGRGGVAGMSYRSFAITMPALCGAASLAVSWNRWISVRP